MSPKSMPVPARINADLDLLVSKVACEAKDVIRIELRSPDGRLLPPFEPGAHLELRLPNGLVRHYSICSDPGLRESYRLGIGLPAESRGGARFIHESLRVGDRLSSSAPRNHFPLSADAQEFCFIAGGIGITPILSMVYQCFQERRPFRLLYCARSRQRAGFLQEVRELAGDRAELHFDDEHGDRPFDVVRALETVRPEAHVYCCGPMALMQRVEAAGNHRPPGTMHFEWFSPQESASDRGRAITVQLRSTGRRLIVPPAVSILEALEQEGILVPSSCREGLCGTCRTGVTAGVPDHRDSILSDEERASNNSMMICVSRAHSEVIELDL